MSTFRALRAEKSSFLFPACSSSSFSHGGETREEGIQADCLDRLGLLAYAVEAGHRHRQADEETLARYLLKFSKGGKATAAELHQDDLGLLDPSGDSEGYLVQAASGAIEL